MNEFKPPMRQATETKRGGMEIADNAEVLAGVAGKAVDAEKLKYKLDQLASAGQNDELAILDANGKVVRAGGITGSQVIGNASTGILSFTNPLLTINAGDNTKFDVGSFIAVFSIDGVYNRIEFAGQVAVTDPHLTSADLTFVSLDSTGALYLSTSLPTNTESRSYALIGAMGHTGRTVQQVTNPTPQVVDHAALQGHDLYKSLGMMNLSGNTVSAVGANLQIQMSAGTHVALFCNAAANTDDPHNRATILRSPAGFYYATQAATPISPGTTAITTTQYDVGGTLTTMTNNRWQNFRVFMTSTGVVAVQHGQAQYTNLDAAKAAVFTEVFVLNPTIANLINNGQAVARCVISVKKGETALNSVETHFSDLGKFGVSLGGAATSAANLQGAYNNSVVPQITVDDTHGAFQIKNGRALDSSNVAEWTNLAGTVKASVRGDGSILSSGPNNHYAPSGYVVSGDDIRLGMTGGIEVTSATGVDIVTPNTYDLTGAFDISWQMFRPTSEVNGTSADHALLTAPALAGITVGVSDTGCNISDTFASGGATATGAAAPKGVWFSCRLTSTGGVGGTVTFYINGEVNASYTRNANLPAPGVLRFLGYSDGTAHIGRKIRLIRTANFEATADESEGAAKGESRGRLAQQGVSGGTLSQTDASVAFSVSGASATGITLTCTTGGTGFARLNPACALRAAAGQEFHAVADITSSAAITVSGTFNDIAAYSFGATNTSGDTWEVSRTPAADATIVNGLGFGITGTFIIGDTITLTNFRMVAEGTVAAYAPENCTSLNRWLDASGNNYHLLPVGGAKALNPQVPRRRTETVIFDMAASTVLLKPVGWANPTKTGVGALTITVPDYVRDGAPSAQASVEAVAHTVAANPRVTPGSIFVAIRDATPAAADSVVYVDITSME